MPGLPQRHRSDRFLAGSVRCDRTLAGAGGGPIDCTGRLPDGSRFSGVSGLEQALRRRPELFVHALTENLLMFGLGRVLDDGDAPALRSVVRQAKAQDYRFSSL